MKLIFTRGSSPGLRALGLLGLALAFMILDHRGVAVGQIRAALSLPLAPLQYLVNQPVQLMEKLEHIVTRHETLVKENRALKVEQLLLKSQVQRLLAIESENNQLKALLRSSSDVHGKVVIAQLLAVSTDPFVNEVIVDKGTRDAVFVGQPVLDANGVMGQMIEIGTLTSRVLLINDTRSSIPVEVTRNGVRAIAVGQSYSGKLKLINVPQTADIKVGDMLVTSGLSEHYPEGYPVGRVSHIIKDPGLQFATISVEPSAHLDRSREVLLVWPAKPSHNLQLEGHPL